jgi:hypothetical protein
MVTLDPAEILRRFLIDEDQAVSAGKQGLLWPDNHARIEPLLNKASRWLDPSERRRLYVHALRLGCLPAIGAAEHDLLRAAYGALLPGLGPATEPATLKLLLVFGHDGRGALPGDFTEDHAGYQRWLKLWNHVTAYTSVPGMLAKVDRFRPYAGDSLVVARAFATLRHTRYEHGFMRVGSLPFWGLALVVLLGDAETRARMLGDIAQLPARNGDPYLSMSTEELRATLDRYLEKTGGP